MRLSPENRKVFLAEKLAKIEKAKADLDVICALIYKYQGIYVTLDDESRGTAGESFWRQAVMYIANTEFGLNCEIISLVLNRDRTTVVHALSIIEDARDYGLFDDFLNNISGIIKAFECLDNQKIDITKVMEFKS